MENINKTKWFILPACFKISHIFKNEICIKNTSIFKVECFHAEYVRQYDLGHICVSEKIYCDKFFKQRAHLYFVEED